MPGKKKVVHEPPKEAKKGAKAPLPLTKFTSDVILSDEVDVILPQRPSKPSAQLNIGGKVVKNPYVTPEPRIDIIRVDNPKFKGAKKS